MYVWFRELFDKYLLCKANLSYIPQKLESSLDGGVIHPTTLKEDRLWGRQSEEPDDCSQPRTAWRKQANYLGYYYFLHVGPADLGVLSSAIWNVLLTHLLRMIIFICRFICSSPDYFSNIFNWVFLIFYWHFESLNIQLFTLIKVCLCSYLRMCILNTDFTCCHFCDGWINYISLITFQSVY